MRFVSYARKWQNMSSTASFAGEHQQHVLPMEPEFSLVLGGPLYQLYLRTKFVRAPLNFVWRRVIGMSAICWLPLFVLSLIEGHAFRG
jgi:hypothetical protein